MNIIDIQSDVLCIASTNIKVRLDASSVLKTSGEQSMDVQK